MGNSTSIYDKIQEHKRIHWFTTETMSSTMFQPYGEAWKWLENIGNYLKMDSFLKLFSNFFFPFSQGSNRALPELFPKHFSSSKSNPNSSHKYHELSKFSKDYKQFPNYFQKS